MSGNESDFCGKSLLSPITFKDLVSLKFSYAIGSSTYIFII